MNPINTVKEFMVSCDQPLNSRDVNDARLYYKLILEEFDEFLNGKNNDDHLEILDGICDTIWVLIGYAHTVGYDIQGAMDEVARSNMSKVDPVTGKVIKRDDGKILKPESYSKPNLEPFLQLSV